MNINHSEMYNIIPIIFKNKIHEGSCYHYTNIEGFLLMMEDIREKKCYIFPGHTRYQNDIQELSEGVSYVKLSISQITDKQVTERILEDLNELDNNIYISCFSSDRDSLEQWKYYGSNCGLSIEFDFAQCEGFFNDEQIPAKGMDLFQYDISQNSCNEDTITKWDTNLNFDDATENISKKLYEHTRGGISLTPVEVLYSDEEKNVAMENMLGNNIESNMSKLSLYSSSLNKKAYVDCAISTFIPICKNHYFAHEKEARLLFFPDIDTKIKYRKKNGRILPYLKCIVVNKDENKYPISSVTVGPGSKQNLIFNAVINILEGHDNTKFFPEEDEQEIIKQSKTYSNLEKLKSHISSGEFCCYKRTDNEKVLVYCSTTGILVYKSDIPFRD